MIKAFVQTSALLSHSAATRQTLVRAFHTLSKSQQVAQRVRYSQNYYTIMNVSGSYPLMG